MKYLHPSLLFMVCALFVLTSAAQTKVKPEIIYSTQPQKYVLGGVAIDGIKGYDDDLLLNIAGLEVGSTYEVPGEGISQAIRNYWKQGLFSNVEIDADSLVGDTIYLHIRLTAQPRITSINFTGMKKTEREEIEARIPLRAGNQITPNLVDRTKRRILKYYEEKGYKNAEVNIVQHEDPTDTHKMLVDIDVKKNNFLGIITCMGQLDGFCRQIDQVCDGNDPAPGVTARGRNGQELLHLVDSEIKPHFFFDLSDAGMGRILILIYKATY